MDRRFTLLLVCFFLSGFSALLYQTAWTREFAFVFGTSEIAIAAVLAGYMGGLALGSAAAARIAPRVTRPILAYGVLELAIAGSALALPLGMRGLTALYVAIFAGGEPGAIGALATPFRLAGAFALLLPPTALMGATLPLLARHAVRRDEQVGPRVGALYAINTAGAIGGTVCAAFLLLPALGLRQTVAVGALVNGLVFAAAALLARGAPAPPVPLPTSAGSGARRWVLPLMLVSGAVSFGYEILWTRLLAQLLGGSVYAFATMLASFLLGIALGSAAGGLVARRPERAATGFAWSQIGVALLALAAFAAADRLPALADALGAGWSAAPIANAPLAALVLLPVASFIGATFPLAVRVLAPDPAATSEATARVYAWNTVGAIAGAIGTGFWILPSLGFAGALRVGCTASLAVAAAAALWARPRARAPLAAAAACGAALWLLPVETPWQLLRASPFTGGGGADPVRYFAVGRSATVLLVERPGLFRLFSNGLPESTIVTAAGIPGREIEARWLGLLPVLLRPRAERVLVIGLGGGVALEGIPPTVDAVDVVELEGEVVAANRAIGAERARDPLADPRVRVVVDDARGALLLSDRRYHAIVSQPSHPWTAGASHLYTREFFALARERLADDGVFVQWIGVNFVDESLLRSLLATLVSVFPHVDVYRPVPGALLFAGSNSPLDISAGREALAAARDHFARHGLLVIEDAAACLVLDTRGARALAADAEVNSDDHNLLASGSARLRGWPADGAPLRRLLAEHDPLPALAGRLARLALARSLVRRHEIERAEALATGFPGLEREIALGYAAVGDARGRAAAGHFRRALALDPTSQEARIGAALLERDGAAGGDIPEPVAILRRAAALPDAGDSAERLAIDAELAAIDPGSALFDAAALLRADWRIRSGEPERAAEALAILDLQVPRTDHQQLQLRRAEAAGLAGRAETAWVALDDVAQRLRRDRRVRRLALRALALADELAAHPLEERVRARLLHAAR